MKWKTEFLKNVKRWRTVIVLLIGVLVLTFAHSRSDIDCKNYFKDKSLEINGVVINKWIDYSNHADRLVTIRGNGLSQKTFDLSLDVSGLFEAIEPGDTILKEKGSYSCRVSRNGSLSIYKLDYDCSDRH